MNHRESKYAGIKKPHNQGKSCARIKFDHVTLVCGTFIVPGTIMKSPFNQISSSCNFCCVIRQWTAGTSNRRIWTIRDHTSDSTYSPLLQTFQNTGKKETTPSHKYRASGIENIKKPYLWNAMQLHHRYTEFINTTSSQRRILTTISKIVMRDSLSANQQQSRQMAFITGHTSTKRKIRKSALRKRSTTTKKL